MNPSTLAAPGTGITNFMQRVKSFAQFGTALIALLAATTLQAAEPRAPLIVGVENQYYLPAYAYENGQYKGFARDLLDAFARDKGYQIEYRALPVQRLYASFFSGQVDFKFPDNPNWQGEKRTGKAVVYSEPVIAFVDGVSVKPERKTAQADDIHVLGTVSGFTPWSWGDRLKSGKATLAENASLDALVRQTIAGRIDGAYASVAVINYQLDHVLKQPGALVFHSGLPFSRDHYFLSSIKRPEVIREFSQWMKQNRSMIAALKKQHGVEKGVGPD
jgi:ABC-type amino acid transport substrate-binding protein